jgi:hypothetical protein
VRENWPLLGGKVERGSLIICLKFYVTARTNELLRDGLVSFLSCEVDRSGPFLRLKIDVTARSKELLCDVLTPFMGRGVKRRCTHSRPGS